jgi:hypothetical protein
MVAVVLSGVIGRFIYIQIPRTIEGRALSLNEVKHMKTDIAAELTEKYKLDEHIVDMIVSYTNEQNTAGNYKSTRNLRKELKSKNLPKKERNSILKMVKDELSLSRKIGRLETMQRLFKYWHVAHMPFALVMLIIVIIHVGVTVTLGYKWIF